MARGYDIKFVIRTAGQRPDKWYDTHQYAAWRYSGFLKGLQGKKVGFIQFEDIMNHLQEGKDIPVFEFDISGKCFKKTDQKGIDAQVVATEVFESVPVSFAEKSRQMSQVKEFYRHQKEKGSVQTYINSLDSLKSQDKYWLLDVQRNSPQTPMAPSFFFSSKKDLEEFLKTEKKEYILKARLGMAGVGTGKLTEESLESITDENIQSHVIQEEVKNIICELRVVYGPHTEHLGTRAFFQRRAPWEKRATSQKKHTAMEYELSDYEKEISRQIISYAGVEVGSADWLISVPESTPIKENISSQELAAIIHEQGQYYFAEINGFGTNFGPLVSPYDLNETVARKISQKYLQD
ncbi:MAG: hypothetical protein KC535_03720 [Nanoarchaeota archaeon]|nr:hypothetical protein [Nanoarchaeota archaeon]